MPRVAAGGEGAAPPHTAWVHRQSRGRRQDPPRHGWEWVALGRGLAAPGPSHHDDLGQAGGGAPTPRRGTIPWLSQLWTRRGWDFAPPPRPNPQVLGEGLDEDSHWAAAARMAHSLVGWPSLEPALEAVLEFRREWRHDLARIRQDVLDELRELAPPRGWRPCPLRTGPAPFRASCSIACFVAWATQRPTTSNKT